jgi:glycosyltransferase involved in cell wall biosynthesis
MRIAIATTFDYMDAQYSLVTVVRDRYQLLKMHGHTPEVWVQETFRGEDYGMNIKKIMPTFQWMDYANPEAFRQCGIDPSDMKRAIQERVQMDLPHIERTRKAVCERLEDGIEVVFCEDIMFQGWFHAQNLGFRQAAAQYPNVRFFSVAHSVPQGNKPIWTPLPPGSKLIALNETIVMHVAENYRTTMDNVHVIYNSMDFRTYADRDPIAIEIYEKCKLMEADIIQVYPFSTERWRDKGVDKLFKIFASLKQIGNNVKLILATAWHFPVEARQIREEAERHGLTYDDVIITTELYPNRQGIPNRAVRELMSISNLFVFPTRAEASPLILAEAMMAGCYIVVNDLLPQLMEIAGYDVTKWHLNSSLIHNHSFSDEELFFHDVARAIDAELRRDPVIKTKTRVRKQFCFEYLYKTQYAPLLYEVRDYNVVNLAPRMIKKEQKTGEVIMETQVKPSDIKGEPSTNKFQCQNPDCRNIFYGSGGTCPRCGSTDVAMMIEG